MQYIIVKPTRYYWQNEINDLFENKENLIEKSNKYLDGAYLNKNNDVVIEITVDNKKYKILFEKERDYTKIYEDIKLLIKIKKEKENYQKENTKTYLKEEKITVPKKEYILTNKNKRKQIKQQKLVYKNIKNKKRLKLI